VAVTRYLVPAATHRVVEEARRSRFITTLARASGVPEAQAFIGTIREEFPDATHHCWAYLIGPPGTTAQIGMSDDGEPHGTAGRPMLNALVHADVGDVVAVVTRYYGGTNLGTGGLVRAYGGGVVHALETLPRSERIEFVRLAVSVDYAKVTPLEQLFPAFEVQVDERRFDADVTFDLRLPDTQAPAFRAAVRDLSRGQARFVPEDGA
jgi:uncharacterized YigZ family protein